MAEKKICNGKEDDVSKQQKNISDCANLCKKTSSMFVYGRHGQKRCWCMMDAADGQCTKGQKAAGSLDLYRIQPGTGVFLIGFDVDFYSYLPFPH